MKKLATVIIASILFFNPTTVFNANATENSSNSFAFSEQVIAEGDTLWAIACSQFPNEDPKEMVKMIKLDNHMNSSVIRVGQLIKIRNNSESYDEL